MRGSDQIPSVENPLVAEMTRRLVEVYHPERIYLFGSAARGDAGPDSDYDFMVVVPDDTPPEVLRGCDGYSALGGLGVSTDVVVWTKHEFDRRLHLKASFPSTIVREGKLLYGA
jgi:predicted nucleotidyltransferase